MIEEFEAILAAKAAGTYIAPSKDDQKRSQSNDRGRKPTQKPTNKTSSKSTTRTTSNSPSPAKKISTAATAYK